MNAIFTALTSLLLASVALADGALSVVETTAIGPLTGEGASLHPDNLTPRPIEYYGTDLGEWPDPGRISPNNIPLIKLGQNQGTSETSAINPGAEYDIVDQNTFAWVEPLKKWVMFFGGGLSTLPIPPALMKCGLVELFSGPDCKDVEIGDGAIRMRTADNPWGPWSPAQDVIVGGDPAVPGSGQYGVGGMLRHPACTKAGCAPHTDTEIYPRDKEYGFFYAPNIIEQWIKPVDKGVDLYWIVSTWDPYRVILLRTRLES